MLSGRALPHFHAALLRVPVRPRRCSGTSLIRHRPPHSEGAREQQWVPPSALVLRLDLCNPLGRSGAGMQLDRRHLATAARFGAVGGKTTTPRIHRARGAAEVAPFKGPTSSQCPSGLVVLGAAGRAGSPAGERASGGARRGAARGLGGLRGSRRGWGLAARRRMCGAGGGGRWRCGVILAWSSLGLLCLGLHMLPGPRCLFPY